MHRVAQRPLDYKGSTLDTAFRVRLAQRCVLLTCKKIFPLMGHKDLYIIFVTIFAITCISKLFLETKKKIGHGKISEFKPSVLISDVLA